jgi:hypothetical protein
MTLYQYLSEYTQTLQKILETHQNEIDIMRALEKAYTKDDTRFKWVQSQLVGGTKKGIDDDGDIDYPEEPVRNKPVNKK